MRPASNPWVVLATLLAIYIVNYADRYLITGLIGPIKAQFGIGDAMVGMLMGPAFVFLYVVLGVPFARLADRTSRVQIIAAGCVLWSGATIATGLASGPVSLTLARVAVGVGEAAFVAPAYSLLSDYFRPERRGLAFAILGLAAYAGQIAGQAGGPAIAAVYDWRMAFYSMGAIGLVLGLAAMFLIREPRRNGIGVEQEPTMPLGLLIQCLARSPAYMFMMFAFGFGVLSGVSFGYWGPELFTRAYGLDPVAVKSTFALNFGLSGLVGMLLFGALSDRLARRSMIWPSRLSALALGAATCAILMASWAGSFNMARIAAIPAGLLGGGWSVGFLATLQYMLPSRIRAASTAMFLAVTTLIGFFIGPWVTGWLSQIMGNDAASLRMALTLVIPFGFLSALLGWAAAARVERDRAALDDALSIRPVDPLLARTAAERG
ncbi:spinster family MFS transporter [Sphingobium vermicomposti]|uniref:MFS family permease n=1 Tax=Sphingobium vermicomposti TaxID=529005 RepID=A0A846MH90_9SPHN|nr:MFS transporter [Sphingobium vermicomposti]NIJ18265.1 MFS family permease [Sphingobium vermicomposti]